MDFMVLHPESEPGCNLFCKQDRESAMDQVLAGGFDGLVALFPESSWSSRWRTMVDPWGRELTQKRERRRLEEANALLSFC